MVREPAERACFAVCLVLGRLLRSARYSTIRFVSHDGELRVHKQRRWHAPLLVWLGGPLARALNIGVRVLPQRDWEERERLIYGTMRAMPVWIDAGRTLVLPRLPGATLASILEDRAIAEPMRNDAIAAAVVALAEFHRRGFTHGDAMAENVLVDLDAGTAHWFDFETVHDARRPMAWRRADDLRALLATCLIRTAPDRCAETLRLVLDLHADDEVARLLVATFTSMWRRPLIFHLAQAGLSYHRFSEIESLLTARYG
jgi:hypothetical protein